VETITDAVSIHSIKKAEYAKRLASGRLGHVTLMDHFISVRAYGRRYVLALLIDVNFNRHMASQRLPNL
jgi:hypothetical protein